MFYTASYFRPNHFHGQLISISISAPSQFGHIPKSLLLAPSKGAKEYWKSTVRRAKQGKLSAEQVEASWEHYSEEYYQKIDLEKERVNSYLLSLAGSDTTFLCWEKPEDEFPHCHRNLLANYIQQKFPYLWGGADAPHKAPKSAGALRIEQLVRAIAAKGDRIEVIEYPNIPGLYALHYRGREIGDFWEVGLLSVLIQLEDPTYPRYPRQWLERTLCS